MNVKKNKLSARNSSPTADSDVGQTKETPQDHYQSGGWRKIYKFAVLVGISTSLVLLLMIIFGRFSSAENITFARSEIDHTAGDCKAAGDIDDDGYPDLVIGGMPDEKLNWYRYPSWQKTVIATPAVEFTTDCALGDVDGDGDFDIVVADGQGENNLKWFENPRPTGDPAFGSSWREHPTGSAGSLVKDVKLADFDKNGRLDVAVRTSAGNVYVFFQYDADSWSRVEVANFGGGEGLGIGDIDQDGDTDLIGPGYWLENPENPQTEIWPQHYIASLGYFDFKSVVADFDKDGLSDIAFSCSECDYSSSVMWFGTSNPKGSSWTEHYIASLSHAHTLQAYDMDLDGNVDVITGQLSQSSGHEVIIYLNNGNGLSWTKILVDTPSNGIHNGVVVDIGNDGDYDIYGAGYADHPPVWLWENQLNPLKGGDINNDERADINNDGLVNVSDLGILLSSWASTSRPPADINQDGRIDTVDFDIIVSNWYNP